MVISRDDRLAHDLAAEAGRRLITLRAVGGDQEGLRRDGDRLSHEFLCAELATLRPADAVLSEEGRDDPARLSASRVWIVDPLDGTREFGEPGRTDWAVHVALWERGDLSAGAVALPAQGRILSTANIPATPHGAAATAAGPGQLRIVVSRTRPPEYNQRLADRAGAVLLPLGSAGGQGRCCPMRGCRRVRAQRRAVRVGLGRSRRRRPGSRTACIADRRREAVVQPGLPLGAGYPDLPGRARKHASRCDQLGPASPGVNTRPPTQLDPPVLHDPEFSRW